MPLDPGTLVAFAAVVALICVVPGPDMMYIVASGVRHGGRGGAAAAVGMAAGMLVHTTAAAIGLSALLRSSATAFEAVRAAGAAYLLWMGVQALRRREPAAAGPSRPAPGVSVLHVGRQAMLTNLLNPKVVVFFLAFLPPFVDRGHGDVALQLVVLGLVFTVVGLAIDLTIGLAAGRLRDRLGRSPRATRILDRVSGVAFLGLAARLATER